MLEMRDPMYATAKGAPGIYDYGITYEQRNDGTSAKYVVINNLSQTEEHFDFLTPRKAKFKLLDLQVWSVTMAKSNV